MKIIGVIIIAAIAYILGITSNIMVSKDRIVGKMEVVVENDQVSIKQTTDIPNNLFVKHLLSCNYVTFKIVRK